MKKLFGFLMAGALVCSLTACDSDDDGGNSAKNPYTNIPIEEGTRGITAHANDFAFNLFNTVDLNADQNACLSPYSLFAALSMTANGADDASFKSLRDLLGIGDGSLEALNSYNKTLLEYLPKVDRKSTCMVNNSLWYHPKLSVLPAFKGVLSDYYAGQLINTDPSGEAGMKAINKWVSVKTKGLITSLIKEPKPWPSALINTAYFKSTWKDKFKKENTRKEDFHNIDGPVSRVDMMHISREFQYAEKDGLRFIALPYGNGNYEMDLVIPEEGKSFAETAGKLTAADFTSLLGERKTYSVNLGLPKFNATTNINLMNSLAKMGISKLTLDKMLSSIISVADVQQGTYIHVDEEGTEAAAATVIWAGGSAGPTKEIDLTFDRPFIYLIRETSTGTILFMGQQVKF